MPDNANPEQQKPTKLQAFFHGVGHVIDRIKTLGKPTDPEEAHISRIDRVMGFLTGTHYDKTFTKQDIKKINLGGPVVLASSALGAFGLTLTAVSFVGVPVALAPVVFGTLMTGYIALDRAIVGEENRAKAHHRLEDIMDENEGIRRTVWEKTKKFVARHIPTLMRVSMAVAAGIVSGTAIMTEITKHETDHILDKRFARDNATLFAQAAHKKGEYDDRIADAQKQLDAKRQQANQAVDSSIGMLGNNGAGPAEQGVNDRLKSLDEKISEQQTLIAEDHRRMDAEAGGIGMSDTSGKQGKGKNYGADKLVWEKDQALLNTLEEQRNKIEAELEKARAADAQAKEQSAGSADILRNQSGQIADQAKAAEGEVTNLSKNRSEAFTDLDASVKTDPTFVPRQEGPVARISALDEYIESPETGSLARGYNSAIAALLISMELAAVIWAKTRRSTSSEINRAMRAFEAEAQHAGTLRQKMMEQISEKEALQIASHGHFVNANARREDRLNIEHTARANAINRANGNAPTRHNSLK